MDVLNVIIILYEASTDSILREDSTVPYNLLNRKDSLGGLLSYPCDTGTSPWGPNNPHEVSRVCT